VLFFEVADFMGEHTDEAFVGLTVDEGVVESNFFPFPEAGEKGVGFGRALGAVHDGDFSQRELTVLGHGFNFLTEFVIGHGFEFVKEGKDVGGGEVGKKERDGGKDEPSPQPDKRDVLSKDPDDEGEEGDAKSDAKEEAF